MAQEENGDRRRTISPVESSLSKKRMKWEKASNMPCGSHRQTREHQSPANKKQTRAWSQAPPHGQSSLWSWLAPVPGLGPCSSTAASGRLAPQREVKWASNTPCALQCQFSLTPSYSASGSAPQDCCAPWVSAHLEEEVWRVPTRCPAAASNSCLFLISWPTELLFWIHPKPEHLQQNFISTNLFITLLWAKFQRFFFPFKDINQKMCKRVGSTLLHTLHSKSQGKCSLFVFCTQEGVENM